jgi:hypothetical protein
MGFIVGDPSSVDAQQIEQAFRKLGGALKPLAPDSRLVVRLVDPNLRTLKDIPIE